MKLLSLRALGAACFNGWASRFRRVRSTFLKLTRRRTFILFHNQIMVLKRLGDGRAQFLVVPWFGEKLVDRALVDRVGH